MASITTRAGKGSPLTNAEVDANFTNINTELGQKLTGNQTVTLTGDASGSGATSIAVTLANSGVTAGTYTKVTVDGKGRVTTGASIASSDVTTALGYTPLSTAGGTLTGGLTIGGNLNMGNFGIVGVDSLTFNDPGPNEGLTWNGGNAWRLFESPNDLTTNSGGNIQFTQNGVRRATFNTSGQLELPIATGTAPFLVSSTTRVANLNVATAGTADALTTARTINGVSFNGTANITVGRLYDEGGSGSNIRLSSGNELEYYSAAGTIGTMYLNYSSADANSVRGPGGSTFINSSNYNSYAPSLTGNNATGTWAISVTGSAGSVSWSNVTSKPIDSAVYTASVNSTTYWTVIRPSGGAITNPFVYRITLVTTGTGSDSGEVYLLSNVDSAGWVVKTVTRSNAGSNYPYVFLDAGVPKVRNDHASLYPTRIFIEEFDTGNSGGLPSVFGLDASFTNDVGTPKYRSAWANSDYTLLHSANYSNYAPSLTGSGASGTWGINITGNAATATSATDSTKLPLTGGTINGTLVVNSTSDSQITLTSSDSWTGIGFNDSAVAGTDYIWHNGGNSTFAIGGGGSNVAGKKLHVHGGMTIGSGYVSTTNPTNGLNVEGAIQQTGNQVLHAANYSSYALPLSGGTLTGELTLNGNNTWYGGSNYHRSNSEFSFLTNTGGAQNGRFKGIQVSDSYSGSVPTNGILFSTDTTLVRSAAGQLSLSGDVVLDAANYSSYALPLSGGTLTGDLDFGYASNATVTYSDSGGVYIPRPQYAAYHTTASTQTGVLTIQLPTAAYAQSDMISFWVDVYDYSSNESVSIFVYGYAYGSSTGQWTNTGATILSPRTDRNYPVRFCHDGTRHVVCIGDVGSTWSYAQVNVRDFQAGYSVSASTWDDGWNITFLTTLPTVMQTSTANYPVAHQLSGSGRLLLTSDAYSWSSYDAYSADNNESGMRFLDSAGGWRATVYGSGSAGGFLNSTNGWDLQKNYNGELSLVVSGTSRTALHSGNYSSYALPLSGGTLTGALTVGDTTTASITDQSQYSTPLVIQRSGNSGKGAVVLRGSDTIGTAIEFGRSNAASNWGTYLEFLVHDDNITGLTGLTRKLRVDASAVNSLVALQQSGNQVLHAGNYSSYALPLSGGTITGAITGGMAAGSQSIEMANADNYASMRVIRNNATTANRDGMYIGYQNSNSGRTRIYSDGSGSGHFYSDSSGNIFRSDGAQYLHTSNYNSYVPTLSGTGATGTWGISVTGNSATATTLATARTIALSGAATGTATSFNGSANITIPVTALNASNLSAGTVPDARLSGTYSGFSHKIDGSNTVFTTPNSGSTNTAARTVYGLAEYRSASSAQIGAIVFIAPNTTSTIMHQLELQGLLYNQNIFRMTVQGYRTTGAWSDTRKISFGTVDIQTRWGVTPDGKNCLILGDVGTSWSYPHISVVRAMFSHSNAADAYCSGWTVAVVTSLTGYTQLTGTISDSNLVGSITGNAATATTLQTARTINGVSFNGSANITVADSTKLPLAGGTMTGAITFAAGQTWPTFNQNTTGSAATLTTSRTINGTSFNGSANITTANWGTARTITIGATGKSVSGSANVSWTLSEIAAAQTITTSGSANTLILQDTGANGANLRLNGNGATTPNKYLRAQNGMFQVISSAYTVACLSVSDSGDVTANGNVTAYSDERVKANWRQLDDGFVVKLAGVKSGIYDRTDIDLTQAGVSAQSLRKVLPDAVIESQDGDLSVAYGNAAMVSAVELAKEIVNLKREIELLKSKLH